jgi:hypothetical protein
MATVIMQTWDGITPGQYDALRDTGGGDRDVPAAAIAGVRHKTIGLRDRSQ